MGQEVQAVVEAFESALGDPRDPDRVFSFARSAELDRAEEFPESACRQLTDWGLQRYYVPPELGGVLDDYSVPLHLMRAVARRDLTVAIAHGKTFLGGVSAWLVPPVARTRALAAEVLRGVPVSWGLTEREHGSDLLAGEVRADAVDGGFRISGEKWLINNATRGRVLSVLARTGAAGDARGFDVFVVDKDELSPGSFQCLPKVRTEGIRGADISGIALHDAFVPSTARLGEPGTGLETVLKGLQLTRTLCSSLSLGAGDHALRLAMSFAEERVLHGEPLVRLPRARGVLAAACADQLLCEVLALTGARAIHALTGELSLVSSVVKYLVPTVTDRTITSLGRLLGARSLLVDGFAQGQFQKLARDHRIVGIFDGNTTVTLHAIVNQFPVIARKAGRDLPDEGVAEVMDLDASPRPFDPARLRLVSRHGSGVLRELARSVARLDELAEAHPELERPAARARRVLAHSSALIEEMAGYRPVRVKVPLRAFVLAERFSRCFAASCAVGVWLAGRERHEAEPFWRDGHWLSAVLARVLNGLGDTEESTMDTDAELLLVDELRARIRDGWSFSLVPHRVGEGVSR